MPQSKFLSYKKSDTAFNYDFNDQEKIRKIDEELLSLDQPQEVGYKPYFKLNS